MAITVKDTIGIVSHTFWRKWYAAHEVTQIAMLNELPSFKNGAKPRMFAKAMTTSLLNSYLRDLAEYIDSR